MPRRLIDATWTDLADTARRLVLAVPLGSTEQHGPHLPLSTDTTIAVTLAERLAAFRSEVVVAPAVSYGSSGEHADFAGTLSIGQDVFERVVVELVRSADDFAAVVLVCAHGGNNEPLARAVVTLRREGRRVLAWSPQLYEDAHAGRSETSVMLALDPMGVRVDAMQPGATQPLAELMDALRAGGVRAVSANGVLGDPTGASSDEGDQLLDRLVDDLVASVEAFLG